MGVYNGLEELGATIQSVLNQHDVELEFIIFDDGSNEATRSTLQRHQQNDPRIKLFHQTNQGLTQALINGCQHATGQYIARHDVGDISHPSRLTNQRRVLESHPETVLVSCAVEHYGPEGEFLYSSEQSNTNVGSLPSANDQQLQSPVHGCVMFRRQAYQQAGGYRAEFYYAQDLDLWTRLIKQGEFKRLAKPLYKMYWRNHSISAHHTQSQRALKKLIEQTRQTGTSKITEIELLQQAKQIRPQPKSETGNEDTAAVALEHWYFIGSQLLSRKDRNARKYLLRVICHRPWHLKAWVKYLRSLLSIYS